VKTAKQGQDPAVPPDPYLVALRLLTARDMSVSALRQKLLQRKCLPHMVEDCLQRLQQERFLDDRRYAERIVEAVLNSGRYVGYRLRQELKRRGVAAELIEELTTGRTDQQQELELAVQLVLSRYPDFAENNNDQRLRRRIAGFLQRRGFGYETIGDLLNKRFNSNNID